MRTVDPYLKEMGRRLQSARKAKKITVRQLGALCNIDYSSISRIESGQYASRITTLKTIADILGIQLKEIV